MQIIDFFLLIICILSDKIMCRLEEIICGDLTILFLITGFCPQTLLI